MNNELNAILYRINQFFFEIDRSYRYINLNDMQKGVNFNFLSPNYQKKQLDLSEILGLFEIREDD